MMSHLFTQTHSESMQKNSADDYIHNYKSVVHLYPYESLFWQNVCFQTPPGNMREHKRSL